MGGLSKIERVFRTVASAEIVLQFWFLRLLFLFTRVVLNRDVPMSPHTAVCHFSWADVDKFSFYDDKLLTARGFFRFCGRAVS